MNDFKVEFPRVEEKDYRMLAELADEIWHDAYSEILKLGQIDYMLEKFQSAGAIEEQILHEDYSYFFVRVNDEIGGYIGVQPQDGRLYLSKIYLKRNFRGRGIFRKMLGHCIEFAQNLGIDILFLTVCRRNKTAIRAYEGLGMKCVRTQIADIGHGYEMDDYIYEYDCRNSFIK